MPTGQILCSNVLTHLGLNSPDGTPGASDSNTVLNIMNVTWRAWGVDEGLIWGQTTYQGVLSANQASYSIGTGGDFNTTRPSRIYKAFVTGVVSESGTTTTGSAVVAFASTSALIVGQQLLGPGIPANSFIRSIVANTSATIDNPATASAGPITLYCTTGNRNEVKIVEAGAYYDHNDLGATAYTPDEIYPDYLTSGSNGTMNLYLFPVPRAAGLALDLDMAVPFVNWTLGTNYNIPDAMQDALEWAVAFRCLSTFGVAVQPQIAQVVVAEGTKAEARLRKANAFNRQLPDQAVMAPGTAEAAALQAQQQQIQRGS